MARDDVVKVPSRRMDNIREVIRWSSHAGAVIPLVVLIIEYLTSNLSANPIQTAEQRTGKTALFLLVIMLAVTPFQIFYKTRLLSGMKKRLGLYSFLYASIHLCIFIFLDYGLNWTSIFKQLTQKTFIIYGFIAFTILLALAITSFRWWKVKLGKNWKRLHRLVYLASILILLHYAFGQKGDVMQLRGNLAQPVIYGSITMLLLLMRLPWVKKTLLMLVDKIRQIGKNGSNGL